LFQNLPAGQEGTARLILLEGTVARLVGEAKLTLAAGQTNRTTLVMRQATATDTIAPNGTTPPIPMPPTSTGTTDLSIDVTIANPPGTTTTLPPTTNNALPPTVNTLPPTTTTSPTSNDAL